MLAPVFAVALALSLPPAPAATAPAPPPPDRAERIAAIQAALVEAGLDGWLFYDFRGSNPLAYRVLLFSKDEEITSRRWYYFVPARGEPRKVVHAIEAGRLDALPGSKAVYLPWQQRQEMVKAALGGAKKVAMEYSPMNDIPTLARVDAGTIDFIRSLGVEVVSSGDLISRFESVWTAEQTASHRDTAAKLHAYVQDAFARVKQHLAGDKPIGERDLQLYLVERMREGGLVEEPPIVAVNGNAANPHYEPSDKKSTPIRKGDVLLIDISTRAKGGNRPVAADITWMAYCGKKSEMPAELVKVWGVVRDARDRAFAFVRDAVAKGTPITGAEVDDVSRGVVKAAGYGDRFLHRTGHSIGEEVHGSGTNIDNLESRDTRRILRRTCFSIEPGIYLEGRLGVRSEIDVYIGDGGAEITGPGAQTEVVALFGE